MKELKFKRRPDGCYETGDPWTPDRFVIERRPYGKRHSFQAYHLGKKVGFMRSSLALAKRDAQQHANGFRGNVASTDPDYAARSAWCYCEVKT